MGAVVGTYVIVAAHVQPEGGSCGISLVADLTQVLGSATAIGHLVLLQRLLQRKGLEALAAVVADAHGTIDRLNLRGTLAFLLVFNDVGIVLVEEKGKEE